MTVEPKSHAKTAIQRHRGKKRQAGECGYGGCHVQTGKAYYCETHASGHATRQKAYREDRA